MTGKSFINITPQGPKCLKGITVTNVPAAHKMQIVILKNYHQATNSDLVTFQVIIAASIKITVFWGMASCSLVEDDRRFGKYVLPPHKHTGGDFNNVNQWYSVLVPQAVNTPCKPITILRLGSFIHLLCLYITGAQLNHRKIYIRDGRSRQHYKTPTTTWRPIAREERLQNVNMYITDPVFKSTRR